MYIQHKLKESERYSHGAVCNDGDQWHRVKILRGEDKGAKSQANYRQGDRYVYCMDRTDKGRGDMIMNQPLAG